MPLTSSNKALRPGFVAISQALAVPVHRLEGAVVEHFALAGRRQDDELVAEVAADRPRGGLHRHRLDAHALEGAQISQQLRVIAHPRPGLVEVEAVGVLHQELAAAHDAEARADLVAELPLDVVERARQVAVALHVVADERGQHFLVGRAVEHLAVVAVLDPQHLRPVGVVAAALPPQVRRLDGRHQHLDGAGAVLLLADDLLDLLEDADIRAAARRRCRRRSGGPGRRAASICG